MADITDHSLYAIGGVKQVPRLLGADLLLISLLHDGELDLDVVFLLEVTHSHAISCALPGLNGLQILLECR